METDRFYVEEYLTLTTPGQVREFLTFASQLLTGNPDDTKARMAECFPFPPDYLNDDGDLRRFTSPRIAKLASQVCKIKGIPLPLPIRVILLEDFFNFLVKHFQEQDIYTGDLISMAREATVRLELGIQFL